LTQSELEQLGLRAVASGANPQKLQQAFATAQIKGDWTPLEREIANVLGASAINQPGVGLASLTSAVSGPTSAAINNIGSDLISQASQLVSSFVGGNNIASDKIGTTGSSSSTSSVSTSSVGGGGGGGGVGDGGILSQASSVLNRLQKVINPPPLVNSPGDPNYSAASIINQNILTRFVSEFGLEQEAIQFQMSVNKVILSVNNFLEPQASADNKINRVGIAVEDDSSTSSSAASWTSWLTSIPQAIGTLAVAAIKFITPSEASSAGPVNKIDRPSQSSYSEIKPMLDTRSIAIGILGVGALGTVAYSLLAASETQKKRRISERSVNDDEQQQHQKWLLEVGKTVLKGRKKIHLNLLVYFYSAILIL
jgi:hypothetical protein